MTIASAAPIAHAGAQGFRVDLNQQVGRPPGGSWCEVLLQNLSQITLAVAIGGQVHLLAGLMANVYPLKGATDLAVTPQVTPASTNNPKINPSDVYQLLLSVASEAGEIPGIYPAPLPAQGAVQLGTLVIPDNVSPNSLDIALPPGIRFVRLNVFAGDLLNLTVKGDQTGTQYLNILEPGMGNWFSGVTGCQITEASDLSITVNAGVGAGHNASIRISGYPTEDSDPTIPRANLNPAQILTAASTSGQAVVSGIQDPSAFAVGSFVLLITQGGAGRWQLGIVKILGGAAGDPSKLTLTKNLQTALAIGDVIMAVAAIAPLESPPATWTGTLVTIPGAGGAFTIQAANSNRRGFTIQNYFGNVAGSVVSVGAPGTANASVDLPVGGYWEMPSPINLGAVGGFARTANGGIMEAVEMS